MKIINTSLSISNIIIFLKNVIYHCNKIPESFISIIARFSIAAVFWKSGQTKINGLAIDLVDGNFQIGWPSLSESVIPLFKEEYKLPFFSAESLAYMAAFAEHFFPLLILLGFATRFSAFALIAMTVIIQLLVYPGAYPTHGTWIAVLLFLMARGPGKLSIDHFISQKIIK